MKIIFILVLIMFTACEHPTQKSSNAESLSDYVLNTQLPVPTTSKNELILNHKYFIISYDENYRLANYVQYISTKNNMIKNIGKRKNGYSVDPQLITRTSYSKPKDIKKSRDGYVNGHMAPSADFRFSQEARDLSNIMSNIAPQNERLNDHAWKKLEDKIRQWTCGEERLVIITGPILEQNLLKLPSGIAVPKKFFKAVLDLTPPLKAVGFIYAQNDYSATYTERALTIENIEKQIGFKLFPYIKDSNITSTFSLKEWKQGNCNLQ